MAELRVSNLLEVPADKLERNRLLIKYSQVHPERTLKEVGELFDVSRQRVFQILQRAKAMGEYREGAKPDPGFVLKTVAEYFNVPVGELTRRRSHHRSNRQVVRARRVAIYLMRQEAKCTSREISQKLGGSRLDSDINRQYLKIAKQIELNAYLQEQVLDIRKKFQPTKEDAPSSLEPAKFEPTQLARLLGVNVNVVKRWMSLGMLKAYRTGRAGSSDNKLIITLPQPTRRRAIANGEPEVKAIEKNPVGETRSKLATFICFFKHSSHMV